jgi:hypothetical protein
LSNHANGFEEQSGPFAVKSCPKSGVGNILTREPAADDIDGLQVVRPTLPDVSFSVDCWPMFCEHSVGVVVNFHLPFADHAGPLKTQIESTDARKQAPECQRLRVVHNHPSRKTPGSVDRCRVL